MVREVAWRVAPRYMAGRARRYESNLRDTGGIAVGAGPFAGMRYPYDLRGVDHAVDKLTGRYEQELHPALERLLSSPRFVDLGAADGYYAVGAALRGCEVHAYELARSAKRLTAKIARMNSVEINQHGKARIDFPDAAILCDLEGAEADLFDEETCQELRGPIVIECHEHYKPGITDELQKRFGHRNHEVLWPSRGRAGATPWLVID